MLSWFAFVVRIKPIIVIVNNTSNLEVYPMQPLKEVDPEAFPAPEVEARATVDPMVPRTMMIRRCPSPVILLTKFVA